MTHPLKFGVVTLQNLPYAALVDRWQCLDELGFDSAWVTDHFADPHPSRADGPWFEGWTLLAALATHTKHIRVGTLVTSMTLRNPAMLARQAMTVDHISEGRLELGVGAGNSRRDHRMTGSDAWDAPERARRFREFVAVLDAMLRDPATTFEGSYYRVEEAAMAPASIQQPRPPLTVAAYGPVMLKIAAQYADTWNSWGKFGASPQEAFDFTRQRSQMLDEFCQQAGRDPRAVGRSLLIGYTEDRPFASTAAFCDFVGRYHEIGISGFIFFWLPDEGHPIFPDRGQAVSDRGALARLADDAIPALRREAGLPDEVPYCGA